MSLILTNRLTEKQTELLKKLGYYGTFNLTVQEAEHLIDELIEQQADPERDPLYDDPYERYSLPPDPFF